MKTIVSLLFLLALAGNLSAEGDPFSNDRDRWMRKAEEAKPVLHKQKCLPVALVRAVEDSSEFQGWRYEETGKPSDLYGQRFKSIGAVTLDFGRHLVGRLSFHTKTLAGCLDSPLRLKFTFGERPIDLVLPYEPWEKNRLGRGWMQDEILVLDHLDDWVTIPRRMAFRYVKIEMDGWPGAGYDFAIDSLFFTAQSSAGALKKTLPESCPPMIRSIFDVGVETLRECMQTVYEDGPKRDQRLWIGDMYRQALANRYSFQDPALTRRGLYLFAALSWKNGTLPASIIEIPVPHPQPNHIPQYAQIWNVILLDYLKETGDRETALDLWKVAKEQIRAGLTFVDENGVYDTSRGQAWHFIDHRRGLDVHASSQGILLFALRKTWELARLLGKEDEVADYPALIRRLEKGGRKAWYNRKRGLVESGPSRQVSLIAQAWMILSGILTPEEGAKAIRTALETDDCVMPGSPYATHYLIEAMLLSGMNEEAKAYLTDYWGGMVRKGFDTFPEAYDPADELFSPYHFVPLNSNCHAWSCTPVYFIQAYPDVFLR